MTCAVSNPATIYDDTVFTKSQRNPSIEGTEFYDYIYDQNGNALMDLYEIPYIYRINSNNTYDLYVNVPTTRTKYLNRIAGTLTDNGTSQVLADDTRTRINFLDEMMSNNLDESTTRLQLFIDKKYISIGTVELVEISGNTFYHIAGKIQIIKFYLFIFKILIYHMNHSLQKLSLPTPLLF